MRNPAQILPVGEGKDGFNGTVETSMRDHPLRPLDFAEQVPQEESFGHPNMKYQKT